MVEISAIYSLQCLCQPGVVILGLMGIGMAYSLFHFLDDVGEKDTVFRTLLMGVIFFTAAQVVALYHGPIHHIYSLKYVPSLRVLSATLELGSYVLMFWSGLTYFRRFKDI